MVLNNKYERRVFVNIIFTQINSIFLLQIMLLINGFVIECYLYFLGIIASYFCLFFNQNEIKNITGGYMVKPVICVTLNPAIDRTGQSGNFNTRARKFSEKKF